MNTSAVNTTQATLLNSDWQTKTYWEVPFGCESLGEVVEGIRLGAHWVTVTVDFVKKMSRFVQPVIADVHILLLHAFRPTCHHRGGRGAERVFDCVCRSECVWISVWKDLRCVHDVLRCVLSQEAHLTLAVGVQVQDTTRSHHCLQRNDLIERHSEQLVMVEAAWGRVMSLVRSEIVMTKSKSLTPTENTNLVKTLHSQRKVCCALIALFLY